MARNRFASRADWLALCDELVAGGLAHLSPDAATIALPGEPSRHAERSDGFEGFARVFLLYAFADAAAPSRTVGGHRAAFQRGFASGTAEGEAEVWPEPDHGNAIANVANLALGLRVLGRSFWDELPDDVQDRVAAWLLRCGLFPTTLNNWVLFRCPIASFLRSVGRSTPELDAADAEARELVETWYDAASGWYSDGAESTYDYYNAFEFHYLLPVLALLDDDLDGQRRARERLDRFLASFDGLIDAAGRPVYVGRSLSYRFAIASPYVVSALLGSAVLPAASARRRASAIVRSFLDRGAVRDGTLERGWYGPSLGLAQAYSGPSAAYFAGRVFAALLLPAEHPFWRAPGGWRRRIPTGLRAVGGATGLVIDPAPRRAFARLVNHGTNERVATVIRRKFDEPLYSRLSYSSVTAPAALDGAFDRSFVWTVDGEPCGRGRITATGSGADWASSTNLLRRRTDEPIATDPGAVRGEDLDAVAVLVTVARAGWQLDLCVLPSPPVGLGEVTYGGWAIADGRPGEEAERSPHDIRVRALSPALESEVLALRGFGAGRCVVGPGGAPFGASVGLPVLTGYGEEGPGGSRVFAAASRLDSPRRLGRRGGPVPELGAPEPVPGGFRMRARWGRDSAVIVFDEGVLRLEGPRIGDR